MIKKFSLVVLFTLLLGVGVVSNANNIEVNAANNGADTPVVKYNDVATYSVSYYNDIKGLNGTNLLNGLATISQTNHKHFTSYDELRGGNAMSDEDPNNPNNLLDFYTGWSISNTWDGGTTWNREHVWCQSLSGGLYGTSGAGSDIHHIRPSIPYINSVRSNGLFADLDSSAKKIVYNGKDTGCLYEGQTKFEPSDYSKGDVARILMYMYMHYSKDVSANSSYSKAGSMKITNIVSASNTDAAWDLLLSWNTLDPVSDFEKQRNDYSASVTGVRNPFIDHSEFANLIWGDYSSGDGALNGSTTPTYYLSFNENSLSLDEEEKYQLRPNTNIPSSSLTYNSTNSNVAIVSNSGLITALSAGTTTISVSGQGISDSFVLQVIELSMPDIPNPEPEPNPGDGESGSAKYIVASTSSVTVNSAPANTTATYSQTYTTKGQITGGKNAVLTLSGYDGYQITGFTLSMKSNKSSGKGSFKLTSGSNTLFTIADKNFNDSVWNGSYTTTYVPISRDLTTPYTINNGEKLVFEISASSNSLYVESFEVNYIAPAVITNEQKAKEEIATIETMAQMNYSYTYKMEGSGVSNVTLDSKVTTSTYMKDTTTNFADKVGLDSNVFMVTYAKNSGSDPYIHKDGHVRIYAHRSSGEGNEFIVYLKDSTQKINNIVMTVTNGQNLVVYNSKGDVITQDNNSYAINDYKFIIKNEQIGGSSNITAWIEQIDINYGTSKIEYTSFGKVDMRFVAEIPIELFTYVESFGFDITVNNKTTNVPVSQSVIKENDKKEMINSFAVGIKDIKSFNTEITAKAYVIIQGEKVPLQSKTYSVISIVNKYIQDQETLKLSDTQVGSLEAFLALYGNA